MNPILIIGYPRSGSTLLRSILGSHPDINMINEPEVLALLCNLGFTPSGAIEKKDREVIMAHLKSPNLKSNTKLHIDSLPAAYLDSFVDDDSLNSLRLVYEFLMNIGDRPFWGEKSLHNSFLIQEIYEMYKDAFFIQLNRDPRSSLRSHILKKYPEYETKEGFLEKPPKLGEMKQYVRNVLNLAYYSTKWSNYIEASLDKLEKLPKENYCIIKYEDLVTNPDKTLEII